MNAPVLLEPQWLPLVLLPLLAILLQRWSQRRSALRFTALEFLEDLSWRPRHARLLAVCAVLGASMLLLTLTEPRLPALAGERRANVMLVMDVSGSMSASDVAPTRLDVAKQAAKDFVTGLPENWRAGIVAFSERAFVLSAPTEDRDSLMRALDSLAAQGGTATGDAIDLAIDAGRAGGAERLEEAARERDALRSPSSSVVVLLSDGKQTSGNTPLETAASRAAALGIPVYTIALGTDSGTIDVVYPDGETRPLPVPPDFAASARLAQSTGGEFFSAVTGRELTAVYDSVNEVLESEDRMHDLTPLLVLVSLTLLAVAALLAGAPLLRGAQYQSGKEGS